MTSPDFDPISIMALTTALDALQGEPLTSLQAMPAAHLAAQYYPRLDPAQPVLLLGPAGPDELARLAAVLGQAYPAGHPVRVLGAQSAASAIGDLPALGALDAGACLLIMGREGASTYEALQDVAAHLRAPEGCPWDRELTWDKLRETLLEESHELLAALDAGDPRKVSEELGDLLLQVAMQTQIAAESGLFFFPDVARQVVEKLIRRHPHVFGDAVVSGTDDVLANWEAIKRAERANNGERRSPLSGIPAGLPALAQTSAYLDRMSRLGPVAAPGAPWESLGDGVEATPETVGEALFALAAWARVRGIDAESALRQANALYAAQVEDE